MKRFAIIVVVLGLFIVIGVVDQLGLVKQEVTHEAQNEPQIVEKEVVVQELETRIKTAQDAKMSEIEASAQAAYDAAKEQALREIELEITKHYREEIQAREVELEKEVGVY